MAHLTDYELAVRKGARKIAKLEANIATQKALVEQVRAIEAIGKEVIIKPLESDLETARAQVAEYDRALAESDARMAELKAKLAASKAKSKGKK